MNATEPIADAYKITRNTLAKQKSNVEKYTENIIITIATRRKQIEKADGNRNNEKRSVKFYSTTRQKKQTMRVITIITTF